MTIELIVNGDTVDETVTNSLIEKSILSLTGVGDSFAILAREPQVYLQTSGGPEHGFALEYRNGSAEQHYSCTDYELSATDVVSAFQSYLADDGRWQTDFEWGPEVFDYSGGTSSRRIRYLMLGVVAVAAWLIWRALRPG
ncbi:MAG: hypothetical protein AAFX10_04685 [Pseudomonadota bacterium]